MQRVIGSSIAELEPGWLADELASYPEVMLDVGTGTGVFVLDAAKGNPRRLVVGLDPVAENMAKNARRALSKKSRLPNAMFLRGSAEELPGAFAGAVDFLTVNYPWGSLLRIVSVPEPELLLGLRRTCKRGAKISILLNYTVFEDADYLERLNLAVASELATSPHFEKAYLACGIRIENREVFAGDPPVRTGWGRQLVRGSQRKTLIIEALAV